MKPLLVLLAIMLLCVGVVACGGADRTTGVASGHAVARDRDDDGDNNDDDARALNFGHAADATDERQLLTLVRAYYAAGAAGDGPKACSMLYPLLSETVPENFRQNRGLHGSTCGAVLTKLFRQAHTRLVQKSDSLKMYMIRVNGASALTLLSFATRPEVRQMLERRVGDAWKIAVLSDHLIE